MSTASPAEPTALYTEKLWPTAGTWIWPILLAITAGVAFAPIATHWGILAGSLTLIVLVVVMLLNVPQIVVTNDTIRVGRANIERQFIGEVTGYRGEDAFQQRGQKLHGLAYMNLRGGLDPVVKIQVVDPRDQTPYWLTSTRRPEELTRVLGGLMNEFRQPEQTQQAAPQSVEPDAEETA